MRKGVFTITLVVGYIFLLKTYQNFYLADILYKTSQKLVAQGKEDFAVKKANEAIQKNKKEPRYYLGRAKIFLAATLNKDEQGKIAAKNYALADMEKALELNVDNLVTAKNLVFTYYILATNSLEIPAGKENTDQNYISETKDFFNYIKHKYDTDVGIFALTAKYEKNLNLVEEFNKSVEKVQTLRPDLLDWHESFNVDR